MRRLGIICISLALLSGCATVPSPETVSQMCEREVAELQTRGHSTDRLHYNTVYARCVDSKRAYEVASQTTRSTRTTDSVDGRFSARDGEDAVTIVSQETSGSDTYERRSRIRRENKWLVVTLDSGVRVTR